MKDHRKLGRVYAYTGLIPQYVWADRTLRQKAQDELRFAGSVAAEEAFGHDLLLLVGSSSVEDTPAPGTPLSAEVARKLGVSRHTHVRVTFRWIELKGEGAFLETTDEKERGENID